MLLFLILPILVSCKNNKSADVGIIGGTDDPTMIVVSSKEESKVSGTYILLWSGEIVERAFSPDPNIGLYKMNRKFDKFHNNETVGQPKLQICKMLS